MLFLCGLALGSSACDRALPEEEGGGAPRGHFEAKVQQVDGGGFELMEGPASYDVLKAQDGSDIFVLRLASLLPNRIDTTRLNLVLTGQNLPTPGLYSVGAPDGVQPGGPALFTGCYRSPNFTGTRYASEAGGVDIKTVGTLEVEGAFEMTVYTELQTGPGAVVRTRLTVIGSFEATRRVVTLDPNTLLTCRF